MKFAILTLLIALLSATVVAAAIPQRTVLVSYPEDTPESVLNDAMHAIKSAGGVITHEFKIIKAFAAKASEASLEKVKTLGAGYFPVVEEDAPVHALGGGF